MIRGQTPSARSTRPVPGDGKHLCAGQRVTREAMMEPVDGGLELEDLQCVRACVFPSVLTF